MKDLDIPAHLLGGVNFSLYSSDEIRKLSVKEITNPVSLDSFLHPTYGGLYDPHLGATENDEVCDTCGLTHVHCPGHMGHINLPVPVYNPVLFPTMIKLLKATCFKCHKLLAPEGQLVTFETKMEALDHGLVALVDELEDVYKQIVADTTSKSECDRLAIQHVRERLTKALEETPAMTSGLKESTNMKNVVMARQELCKVFLGTDTWSKKCPYCQFPARPIRTENFAKVFFFKGTSKNLLNRYFTQRVKEYEMKERKRKTKGAGDYEGETEEVIMEGEDEDTPEKIKQEIAKLEGLQYLTPSDVRRQLRLVWETSESVLGRVFRCVQLQAGRADHPTDSFFYDVLPVPPARFRPRASLGDLKFDNPQTANYAEALKSGNELRAALVALRDDDPQTTTGVTPEEEMTPEEIKKKIIASSERVNYSWIKLQTHVNRIIDMNLDKLATVKQPGVKQILEKKEGLFRMNMMGKRVNFACRSVISPDPYINTNEIGVPMVFARKLTYPQPVTPWNFQELKQAVLNGPDKYPGATMVELEDGYKIFLRADNPTQREAQAKQLLTTTEGRCGSKKVHRHIKNGDVMLLNRQPTLHRPSIQAHRARILGEDRTLRLHYANCKAYNADFDGDEMNAHFPQDEISRAEAYTIAATDYQYLVPKDGTPLAGLIQDHMVSGVRLTLRGRYFCRADYQQLVFRSLTDKGSRIKLLPPSILKPQILWSGKQVLSTLLINLIPEGKKPLNLVGKAKVAPKNWNMEPARKWKAGGSPLTNLNMSESEVVIRHGELLVGVLDKGHYGNTPYGLVHCCYELYGGQVAGRVLTCLARLFTCFLQVQGFTLGVQDILCLPKADKERRKLVKESRKCGPLAASRAFNVKDPTDLDLLLKKYEEGHHSKEGELKDLDLAMKGQTDEFNNRIAKAIIPDGLIKHFPHNNLQLMVQSGAKGSSVNCMQISCLLGQIELEGRRPALMITGKPLPSFPAYDMSPRAGGFITGRFLTGIRPQEYFFHCMAGREGLVDTAVKTSRSGYLQRCIIKHLEGIIVNYDHTVRDADGSILQLQYGEDGLDIPQTQFLNKTQIPFLIDNQDKLIAPAEEAELQKIMEKDTASALWKKIKRWKKKRSNVSSRNSPFLRFCEKSWASAIEQYPERPVNTGRSEAAKHVCDTWAQMDLESKSKYIKQGSSCPDPVLTQVNVSRHLGVVSEPFEDMIDTYVSSNPDKLVKYEESEVGPGQISAHRLRTLLYLRNQKAQVPPGEAVGLLAAQSIGEPSTQMTLNTFHFAGRGEMNVTLGIPRLREILMVASAAIKTPNMDVPICDTSGAKKKAKSLKKKFTKVLLSQVLADVEITEKLSLKKESGFGRSRLYTLKFSFLPHEMYKDEFSCNPASVLRYMENKFFPAFQVAMKRKYEELQNSSLLNTAKVMERKSKPKDPSETMQKEQEEDGISDSEMQDGDATEMKHRERQTQSRDYQGEEEEKEEAGLNEEEEREEEEEEEGTSTMDKTGDLEEDENIENEADSSLNISQKRKRRLSLAKEDVKRVHFVMSTFQSCISYKYDADEELWCEVTFSTLIDRPKMDMATLLEELARKTVVFRTPGISRAFLTEGKMEGEPDRLKIEGVNLTEMYKYHDCLDLNKLYTNDIHALAKVYGIEAASRAIIKEVRDVFAAYGITVDYHHLSLVADYMTFEGRYKAFNRTGIDSNPSPFQKMSFETTMNFLKSATISGARDDLKSPSSRLIVGRTVMGGTGCFDLLQPKI